MVDGEPGGGEDGRVVSFSVLGVGLGVFVSADAGVTSSCAAAGGPGVSVSGERGGDGRNVFSAGAA